MSAIERIFPRLGLVGILASRPRSLAYPALIWFAQASCLSLSIPLKGHTQCQTMTCCCGTFQICPHADGSIDSSPWGCCNRCGDAHDCHDIACHQMGQAWACNIPDSGKCGGASSADSGFQAGYQYNPNISPGENLELGVASDLGAALGRGLANLLFGSGSDPSAHDDRMRQEKAREEALARKDRIEDDLWEFRYEEQKEKVRADIRNANRRCLKRIKSLVLGWQADSRMARSKGAERARILAEMKHGDSLDPAWSHKELRKFWGYVDSNGNACPRGSRPLAEIPIGPRPDRGHGTCACPGLHETPTFLREARCACPATPHEFTALLPQIQGLPSGTCACQQSTPVGVPSGGCACKPLPCHRARKDDPFECPGCNLPMLGGSGPGQSSGFAQNAAGESETYSPCSGRLAAVEDWLRSKMHMRQLADKKRAANSLLNHLK